ncbi:hypothetical protein [Halorubrum lipolyticum]|uniref:Uncharacterized protein n=1 Tax=Halorubrum lipolyticum DSM 21995 TaxID=1227482 RepID=M0P1W2_9EURY|nr:hypothetical protein [Halorubrum lipolyticum]EMA63848.1 hypothetical protein C469_01814 [Halorubrum lipolyticum DSM 21995]
MAKVSVGLRGWRFDEEEIFTDDEELKPLDEIPEEPRERLFRLVSLVEEPCDVCYLEHGEAEVHRCNQAEIVYGEPKGEVLLCPEHEPDLLYWFREEGGGEHAGSLEFGDRFHEWVAAGNEAPEGYESVEHVDEDPDGLPDLPDQQDIQERVEQDFEGDRIDILELAGESGGGDGENELSEDDLEGVDLSTDYPSNR